MDRQALPHARLTFSAARRPPAMHARPPLVPRTHQGIAGFEGIGAAAPHFTPTRKIARAQGECSRSGALHQRLGETQSPLALGRRFRHLVLPEFHLDVRQSAPQGVEWNAVVHVRIQSVWLIIPDNYVAGQAQRNEHWVGKAAVEMAGESDFPGS